MTSPDAADKPAETDFLANCASGGDRNAFGRLYIRVAPALYAYACARLDWRHQDAEDVVAEVWVRALERFQDYDPAQPFRGWIHGFAFRVVKEAQRRLVRRLSELGCPGEESRLDLDALPDDATTLSRQVARNETLRAFIDWARDLDEYDREVLILRGLQGRPHAEVGRALNKTETAVRERWRRLRSRVKEEWSELELLAN